MTEPHYKRGTIRKGGKLYGRYPDGSLYRIYSTTCGGQCVYELTPPDCATAPKCRCRITEVGCSWAGAIGVALLGGLTYAKERFAIHVHQLKERSVGGGIDAVERSVGIAAIQFAVLADSSAFVVRIIHIQSLISIRDEVQDCPIVELRFLYRFHSNGCADENRRMDVA